MVTSKPNRSHLWTWWTDKVLPPLFVALALSTIGAAVSVNQSITAMTSRIEDHERQLSTIRSELVVVKTQSITRAELLETLKRVELQLQLMMYQSGVKSKVTIVDPSDSKFNDRRIDK